MDIISAESHKVRKAYKCLNQNRYISQETIRKHLATIIESLEIIRLTICSQLKTFTQTNKKQALAEYWTLRDLLIKILIKYNIKQDIPHNLEDKIEINLSGYISPEKHILDTIEEGSSSEELEIGNNMAQTIIEFINTATRLIPDFDGKHENLRSFLDALSLVETIQGNHEAVAINLIKTKLKGNARNLIGNETTIQAVINRLSNTVKGESVEVLSAKILNIRQNSKSANAYCSEIEQMTKSLETAYISDGLPCELATKYSTQVAVKAMTKNCNIDRVKLVMEAGQFGNMNEAIGKFVSSCTEATGSQNAILYFRDKPNRNNSGRGRYGNNDRNKNTNYQNNRNNNYRDNNYRRNRRGRSNNYNRQGNYNHNNNNIRLTNTDQDQDQSENSDAPLG